MNPTLRRVLIAIALVGGVIFTGALALYALGAGRWHFGEALYMAIISVSTAGFGELPGLEKVNGARAVTSGVILLGLGAVAYFQSSMTALIVEGVIGQAWRKQRMRKTINRISGHVVVAGIGSTGRHVVEELSATQTPFVVIDNNLEALDRVNNELFAGAMVYVHGDATEDATLLDAGVERAEGVIAALTDDKSNLFVSLTARTLNPRARIVTKVVEAGAEAKMVRAGANATVSPNIIGGRRMVSECIRPEVVEFLDQMMRDKDRVLRLEEVTVPMGSKFANMALRDVPIRRDTDALVVAVRDAQRQFLYNPGPDYQLAEGAVLVVLAQAKDVRALRELMALSG